ncbi:MAG: hypothetical protein D8H93_05405 [Capnocytophaga sp.]|jgi:hypothetical protein|nr:MAG: hypothetical protein D8H93_05405 [Capnocytophaga sp.]
MKLDGKKLQERLNENLRKLFSYCIDDYFEWNGKEEYYIILTEELLNWLEKVGYYIDTIDFLRETHLGKYVYISYYGDPFDEEAKRIVEEKTIDLYGSFDPDDIDTGEGIEGINIEYLDDEIFDTVSKDYDRNWIMDYNIGELVVIRSILQVLNDKN